MADPRAVHTTMDLPRVVHTTMPHPARFTSPWKPRLASPRLLPRLAPAPSRATAGSLPRCAAPALKLLYNEGKVKTCLNFY